MTQSVPDNISMDDLHGFLETAKSEDEIHAETCSCSNDDQDLTPEFIEKVASDALNFASDKCNDPLVHKVMAMMIVSRMIAWHNTMAELQFKEGNLESAACWYRDAGKFQSMMDSLVNIGIGPDDFTCDHD